MTTEYSLPIAEVIDPGPTIQISECFGPTFQGEGIDIGRPCFFIRLQGCPTRCPGCDTFYTWDGSEKGKITSFQTINNFVDKSMQEYEGCGIVLSGGEPLIHYKNTDFIDLLTKIQQKVWWLSLETSGYVSSRYDSKQMLNFLRVFNTIHLSPKITPCLHGKQSDEEALLTQQDVFSAIPASSIQPRLVYKFVARDEEDVEAILKWEGFWKWQNRRYPIYLMPYGIHREEIIETSIRLLPYCAKYGFILSPRLHSILWGAKRGV